MKRCVLVLFTAGLLAACQSVDTPPAVAASLAGSEGQIRNTYGFKLPQICGSVWKKYVGIDSHAALAMTPPDAGATQMHCAGYFDKKSKAAAETGALASCRKAIKASKGKLSSRCVIAATK